MRKLAIIIMLAFAVLAGWSQAIPISNGPVINQYGQPQPFASIRVCSVTSTEGPGGCTPTVAVWLDYGLSIPSGNPFQADQYGNYTVYAGALAAPNLYLVEIIPQSGVKYTYVINGPGCSLSGCTFTGPITATFFNATQSPYYEVNGVQLACANLSDCANLAKINAANVFTGTPQTAPIFNATTEFDVNGVALSAANLSNGTTGSGQIVLANSPTLITPNIGAATGASLALSGALSATTGTFSGNVSTPVLNAGTGYQIAGAAPLNHLLVGNGANYVDAATLPPGSLPTVYYQTVRYLGASMPQETTLGIGAGLVAQDLLGPPANTQISVKTTASNVITDPFVVGAAGAGTSGHCAQWDLVGGVGDSGAPCGSTGSGLTSSNGYYVSPFGVIFEWGIIPAFDTGPTTITLPFAMPHALFNVQVTQCSDSVYCSGASTTTRQWEWGLPTTTTFQVRNDGSGAATYSAIGW